MSNGNLLTGKGLSANSVNGIVTVIQNSLKLAYTLGETKEYVADRIKRPKPKEKAVTCFTLSEQKKIEQAVLADKRSKMFGIVLCLYKHTSYNQYRRDRFEIGFDNQKYVHLQSHGQILPLPYHTPAQAYGSAQHTDIRSSYLLPAHPESADSTPYLR